MTFSKQQLLAFVALSSLVASPTPASALYPELELAWQPNVTDVETESSYARGSLSDAGGTPCKFSPFLCFLFPFVLL